jgi:hypothetical protein
MEDSGEREAYPSVRRSGLVFRYLLVEPDGEPHDPGAARTGGSGSHSRKKPTTAVPELAPLQLNACDVHAEAWSIRAEAWSFAMALLWVIPVDLFASFADLLDNDEVAMAFNDSLDLRLFVARDQHEVIALAHDAFVIRGTNVDGLETSALPTFAVEAKWSRDPVSICALLDSLVDSAKDLFVTCRSVSEVHARAFPGGTRP